MSASGQLSHIVAMLQVDSMQILNSQNLKQLFTLFHSSLWLIADLVHSFAVACEVSTWESINGTSEESKPPSQQCETYMTVTRTLCYLLGHVRSRRGGLDSGCAWQKPTV